MPKKKRKKGSIGNQIIYRSALTGSNEIVHMSVNRAFPS